VKAALENPSVSASQKADLMIDLAGLGDNSSAKNFLLVLADHKRLKALGAITEDFEALKAQLQQQVDVEVASAFDLTEEQSNTLRQALATKLNRQVNLTSKTDRSLIGGVVVRAGDLVIDASIKGRIEKMAWDLQS